MSEQPNTPPAAAPEPPAATPEQPQGEPATELGPNGTKALAEERKQRRLAEKTAADFKARLDALEQANLSEVDKAKKAAQDAQAQLTELTKQNLRNKVALQKGVPADLVEFLSGDSEDEITEKADLLLKRLNAPTSPKSDPSQGARGESAGGTPADQFATFLRRQLT
jgi:hypothetical protein